MRAAARRWLQCLADPGPHCTGLQPQHQGIHHDMQPSGGGAARRPLRWPVQPDPWTLPGSTCRGHAAACGHLEGSARIRARGLRFPDCRVRLANCLAGRAAAAARRDMTCSCPRHIAAVEQWWRERGNSQKPPAAVSVFQAEPRRGPLDRGRPSDQRKHQRRVTGQGNQGRRQRWCVVEANTTVFVSSRAVPPTHPPSTPNWARLESPSLNHCSLIAHPLHHFERRPPPWHVGCLFRKMRVGGTVQGTTIAVPQADSRQPSEDREPHPRRATHLDENRVLTGGSPEFNPNPPLPPVR
jgi:hypothetical protein